MKWEKDIIVYENKEYPALEILKYLDLSAPTYRNKRRSGLTPMEAFSHCLKLKQKKNKTEGLNVLKLDKDMGISKTTIYKELYNGVSIDKIIYDQKKKKAENANKLAYLREIGLPIEYSSLTEFCNKERLDLNNVYNNIQNGMNLYYAVLNSFTAINNARKYNYCGLQLKAIALKYGLDANRLRAWLRKDLSYLQAIEKEVFARTFSKNLGGRLIYLWNIYQNEFLNGIDVQNKVLKEELENFVVSYNRMEQIKKDLNYYHFLERVYIERFKSLDLDERVKRVLIIDNMPFTLSELYFVLDFENGLMKEFEFVEEYGMWIYNGNREVLKKLKKPSDKLD